MSCVCWRRGVITSAHFCALWKKTGSNSWISVGNRSQCLPHGQRTNTPYISILLVILFSDFYHNEWCGYKVLESLILIILTHSTLSKSIFPDFSFLSNIKSCISFNSLHIYSQILCIKYWPKIFKNVKCFHPHYFYNLGLIILVTCSPLITRVCSLFSY